MMAVILVMDLLVPVVVDITKDTWWCPTWSRDRWCWWCWGKYTISGSPVTYGGHGGGGGRPGKMLVEMDLVEVVTDQTALLLVVTEQSALVVAVVEDAIMLQSGKVVDPVVLVLLSSRILNHK